MRHNIDHDLDLPTAKKVTDCAFGEYKARFADYHPSLTWATERRADISFNAKGISINGAMHLEEKAIGLELDVPFLLRPFQKKAIDIIEREVKIWIEKAHRGEI